MLVGFCSFMTPFLLPSNPTDTKTMLVPTCYFRVPDWLIMTRLPRGFRLRSKVYI